jgi:NAD(P)H-dependent FMN reductase
MAETHPLSVLSICGSLRKGSFNAALQRTLPELAPAGLAIESLKGVGDLPLYNADVQEAGFPQPVTDMGAAIRKADGLIFCTPEYNYSIPGVLKNAIDWLSRPFGSSALKDKPLAVVGGSFGQYGGVWAHDETRKSLGIAGPRVVESLKLSVPFKSLDGKHPRENAEVTANLRDIVGKLAAEVG